MLADELIASSGLEFLGSGRAEFVKALRRAHRFELDDAFTAAADELGTSRPSAFERAIPLCRPPYDFAWFETSQAARKRFSAPSLEGDQPIKRIGILLQAIEDDQDTSRWLTRWAGVLAWSFHDGTVSTCAMAMLFDCGEPPYFSGIPNLQRAPSNIIHQTIIKSDLAWANDPKETPAAFRIADRTHPVPNSYFSSAFENLAKTRGNGAVSALLQRQAQDWSAEEPFWLGVLALFHSRNASVALPGPNLDKLNKVRRKRGQPELLTYSTCRIAPKLRERIAGERSSDGENAGIRAHFVRGHFKIRSSGVFWWSPFLRGDKRVGFAAKDYQVVGEQG